MHNKTKPIDLNQLISALSIENKKIVLQMIDNFLHRQRSLNEEDGISEDYEGGSE